MRVVLGVGGGIAAYKSALLLRLFTESGHDVTVVPTSAALNFVGAPTWEALSGKSVHTDVWTNVPGVPHVKIGQAADVVVVAPATADLLAQAAHGLAGDLLTNTLLTARCPVVMAPAMHTEMWLHPATQANVATLRSRGVHVIDPESGRLTGKDTGPGRLPEPQAIFAEALRAASSGERRAGASRAGSTQRADGRDGLDATATGPQQPPQEGRQIPSSPHGNHLDAGDLSGVRVVVTAGGTREAIDPVRFLGNRSSGKMGFALAEAARRAGARVTLITTVSPPADVAAGAETVNVESALEMRQAVTDAVDHFTADEGEAVVLIMAAAVADFRPDHVEGSKIKKTHDGASDDSAPVITLVRNPDILAENVHARDEAVTAGRLQPGERLIVGFAAETGDADGDVLFHARAKLARKKCDLLVANEVGDGLTFGQDESVAHLLSPGADDVVTVGPAPKSHIAAAIVARVAALRARQ